MIGIGSTSTQRSMEEQISNIQDITSQTLRLISEHRDDFSAKLGRPYFPMNDGWALTFLNTGSPFYVNTRDRTITPWLVMGGHWEPNIDLVMMTYAQPGMKILDIGANMGYYTIKLSHKIGKSGKLVAFDPNPDIGDYCDANIHLNGLLGIAHLERVALADYRGTTALKMSALNVASATILSDVEAPHVANVEVKILDDFEHSGIDLIKIDAEGCEVPILRGAKRTIERSPNCAFMLEIGEARWTKFAPLNDIVELCGGDREIYAVNKTHGVTHIDVLQIPEILSHALFREDYFFVAKKHLAEKFIGDLM